MSEIKVSYVHQSHMETKQRSEDRQAMAKRHGISISPSVPVIRLSDLDALREGLEKLHGQAHGGALLGGDDANRACVTITAEASRLLALLPPREGGSMIHLQSETFTVTASPEVMKRFKRLLALLHYSSLWGHSNTFAMPLDGDGNERFKVFPVPEEFRPEVELIGGVGHSCEIALNDSFTTKSFEGQNNKPFYQAKDACLYRDGVVIRKIDKEHL